MAAKRNGLGKGLDSLIPNKTAGKSEKTSSKKSSGDSKKEDKTGEVMVKINSVEPNREQPRKDFDEDSLVELADSIKQFGILQPLIVQQKKDYYEIIAGERRWRAAKMAGIKEVPVIIKNYTDQEIVEISLIENIQREDLNAIDVALSFQALMDAYKYGAPPHGGMAYGLDRMVMLMLKKDSIRDVIAFPKVQNASEPMTNCPDFVDDKQLDELSLAVTRREETSEEE